MATRFYPGHTAAGSAATALISFRLHGALLQASLTRLADALHGRSHGFNVSVAHVWAEQERLLDKAGQRMPGIQYRVEK